MRVRFCPSPTGSPHVGLARTALFNWAFARHHGGTFVFRIEDTDAARDSQESYDTLLEVMRWLGFEWDEGPEVGGRLRAVPAVRAVRRPTPTSRPRLLEAGRAYHCYCSADELDERNEKARSEGRAPGLRRPLPRRSSEEQVAAYEAEGRRPVVRFRMPDQAITFDDLVRGEITFQPENVPDYVLVRGNGHPLYTLVNPVDDALMEITHVLRGEDLLSSTPRQIALYDALAEIGVGSGRMPEFGHLPYVMGQGNKKLSKRDPEANLLGYRDARVPPRGPAELPGAARLGDRGGPRHLLPGGDGAGVRDRAGQPEPGPLRPEEGRGDQRHPPAALSVERPDRADDALPDRGRAGLRPADRGAAGAAARGGAAGARADDQLTESVDMLGFLFVDESQFTRDPADVEKLLDEDGRGVVKAAHDALAALAAPGRTEAIDAALRTALVEELGLKPRNAFGPVRVAVTGRRVSPPLFESLELLGRERSLARLRRAQAG